MNLLYIFAVQNGTSKNQTVKNANNRPSALLVRGKR